MGYGGKGHNLALSKKNLLFRRNPQGETFNILWCPHQVGHP